MYGFKLLIFVCLDIGEFCNGLTVVTIVTTAGIITRNLFSFGIDMLLDKILADDTKHGNIDHGDGKLKQKSNLKKDGEDSPTVGGSSTGGGPSNRGGPSNTWGERSSTEAGPSNTGGEGSSTEAGPSNAESGLESGSHTPERQEEDLTGFTEEELVDLLVLYKREIELMDKNPNIDKDSEETNHKIFDEKKKSILEEVERRRDMENTKDKGKGKAK